MNKLFSLILAALIVSSAYATPPEAPEGYKWVLVEEYSDEFNGDKLDSTKWRKYFDGWGGRPPAKFVPEAISVSNGTMQIKNSKLNKKDGPYKIAGGAVQSVNDQAHFGYFECRFKASKVRMSTTFWLSNDKEPLDATTDCPTDTYSQELDIVEVVGGHTGTKFETHMNSNTHYRHVPCGARKEVFHSEGARAELDSKVWEDYHTYACWWVNADSVKFYTDDKHTSTVKFNTDIDSTEPFDRPMAVNMVTETYDWCTPYPKKKDLTNDEINTSYYDWIRVWELVKIEE